jgi:hypothetical protein
MDSVLYLPVHTGLSEKELIRLGDIVCDFENLQREATPATQPESTSSAALETEHVANGRD